MSDSFSHMSVVFGLDAHYS